jgi:hypothetical protein
MILCDEPEYNEPGSMKFPGRSASNVSMYTQTVRSLTVGYGITHWAENPPKLWKEIVESHFRKTGDTILKTAEPWARESVAPQHAMARSGWDYGGRHVHITEFLPQLQKTLKAYGATHVIQGIEDMRREQEDSSRRVGYGSQMPPCGPGGRFHGAGGMRGYGEPGFQFGRRF